jgi:hypothetical protein
MTLQERKSWIELARETYNLREERKRLEKREQELFEQLVQKSNNEPFSAGSFALEQIMRKGSVDYSKIQWLAGLNLESYRKQESISWKLTITAA